VCLNDSTPTEGGNGEAVRIAEKEGFGMIVGEWYCKECLKKMKLKFDERIQEMGGVDEYSEEHTAVEQAIMWMRLGGCAISESGIKYRISKDILYGYNENDLMWQRKAVNCKDFKGIWKLITSKATGKV